LLLLLLAGLLYWLLVITEGVYLGRRAVVAMYDWTAHKYDDIKQYEDFAEQFFVARPLLHRLNISAGTACARRSYGDGAGALLFAARGVV
jgi:hypothetical protein